MNELRGTYREHEYTVTWLIAAATAEYPWPRLIWNAKVTRPDGTVHLTGSALLPVRPPDDPATVVREAVEWDIADGMPGSKPAT